MIRHPHASYWERGLLSVPEVTGAASVMDCRDILAALEEMGIAYPFEEAVIDVGCGTGRMARWCIGGYTGLDISEDAVEYCRRSGLDAHLLGYDGIAQADVDGPRAGWVLCLSVFTHMSRDERALYLASFRRLAPRLVADIIPGDGSGDAARWTADEELYRTDLAAAGYDALCWSSRTSPDGETHLYTYAEAL